jgi:phosphate transport system substrate-binding protein
MTRIHHRHIAVLCLTFAGALLAGCTSSRHESEESRQIIGAGSSFIYPIMGHWIADYSKNRPGVRINYQSIGSGGGIRQVKEGTVDFGASDAALDDHELESMPPLLQIPAIAGPVCITYNLPELKDPLRLSGTTLAKLFLGEIKTWQDPAIRKDNPNLSLHTHSVIIVHRADGSGTTNIFTNYLAKVSPEWEQKVGKGLAVNWPVGLGGKGSEGVSGLVKQTPGGIGYVELSYATANRLPVAQIQNQAGNWVDPSPAGATAAIEAFRAELEKDVRTPVVDPPASAKDAYPISGLSFLLVPKQPKDPANGQVVKDFVLFAITEGQNSAEQLQYARLPPSLTEQDQKLLAELKSGQPTSQNPSHP